jgi:hypothetical protein
MYCFMTQLPNDQHITYQHQYRKCGKPSCSTCRDGQGHGPYWYAYWREGSRLRSGYIGKARPDFLDTAPALPASDSAIGTAPILPMEEPVAALA